MMLNCSSGDDFTPGGTYRYLITSEVPMEKVDSMTFTYSNARWFFAPKLHLKYVKMTPMTVTSSRV